MSDPALLALKAEVQDFIHSVFDLLDGRDFDGYADCFLPEGSWDRRREEPPLVGPQAIRGFFGDSTPDRVTRHVTGGIQVWIDGPERARAKTQLTLYAGVGADYPLPLAGPASVVEYVDELVRTPGGWKYQSHHTTIVFAAS